MNEIVNKEQFIHIINSTGLDKRVDIDFLYDVYETSFESAKSLIDNNVISAVNPINNLMLIDYVIGEYLYSTMNRNEKEIENFNKDEKIKIQMASVVADKYMTNDFFSFKEKTLSNRFLPPISSLDTYLNFMLNILDRYKKNDPHTTLILDLLNKSISIARCILDLLCQGHETEAMASWRTFHECESVLILLASDPLNLVPLYLKHMHYSIAYRGGLASKEETDKVFEQLKEEMKAKNLKSKDMKKFIEYGWLYGVKGVNEEELKLNFRDGLETLAGLHSYSEMYEQSSEIIHSTPMLIYSNKEYYYLMTLLNTYESFFRIEKIFASIFLLEAPEVVQQRYEAMRNIYYSQLLSIHRREKSRFVNLTKKEA